MLRIPSQRPGKRYECHVLQFSGERRYLVNPDKCPSYIEALEQQPWGKNGEPDKTTGHDHINDAAGYFIAKEYPIIRNTMIVGTYSTVA